MARDPKLEEIGRDFAHEASLERREEQQSWDATLFEVPLKYPISDEHAVALANLGQAHFEAHAKEDADHAEAWAKHVAEHPIPGNGRGESYARELGQQLGEHASS